MTPLVVLLVLVLSLAEVRYPILLVTLVHLAAFTVLAMLCHTRLAESRPDLPHLTGYFVCVSLGGVLGGAAAALVAPAVFSSILEYPLAIAAALLLRPQSVQADRIDGTRRRASSWRLRAMLLVAGYWACPPSTSATAIQLISSRSSHGCNRSRGRRDAQRGVRASFAIPVALLLFTPRTALLFAGATAGLLVGRGRRQNRRRGA